VRAGRPAKAPGNSLRPHPSPLEAASVWEVQSGREFFSPEREPTALPIHDWTRVDAGLFHAFHHNWITSLSAALNDGVLPPDYYALPEQTIGGPIRDVLTLRIPPGGPVVSRSPAGLAVEDARLALG
jgi:hypothetical protein